MIGRHPYDPPTTHRAWWSETERCSAERGEYERVSWYLADGITGDGHLWRARRSPAHGIVLVAGYEGDDRTVRHEMLHDLLGGDRTHEHAAW